MCLLHLFIYCCASCIWLYIVVPVVFGYILLCLLHLIIIIYIVVPVAFDYIWLCLLYVGIYMCACCISLLYILLCLLHLIIYGCACCVWLYTYIVAPVAFDYIWLCLLHWIYIDVAPIVIDYILCLFVLLSVQLSRFCVIKTCGFSALFLDICL